MPPGSTRERLASAALRLFERHGYEATTVEAIARAAGVSHMTFFRYFPTKESVLIGDPFDPLIARSVASQPSSLPAIVRVARGLLKALESIDAQLDENVRRRIRVAASVPALRARMLENNRATEDAIVDGLVKGGTDAFAARVAAGACLAAITAALWHWAAGARAESTLSDTVRAALAVVLPRRSLEAA
jgi:AcrR family transcriptional regulator